MSDPIAIVARRAAQRLEAEGGPGLLAQVEVALADREHESAPSQYLDPVALASLIVSIVSLAWNIYVDRKKRAVKPTAEMLSRTIRVTLQDTGQSSAIDHIVDVVVTETIRAASDQ
jgi:hypothetical protein